MIRVANIEDYNTINKFYINMKNENYKRAIISKNEIVNILLNKNIGSYFLYEKDNEIIAQILILNELDNSTWNIEDIYLKKDYRTLENINKLISYVDYLAKDMNVNYLIYNNNLYSNLD